MKVLLENFTENIRDQLLESDQMEHYHYREEEQEKEEEALRDAVIKKQKGLEVFLTITKIMKELLTFRDPRR